MARKSLKYWDIFELECNLPGQTPIFQHDTTKKVRASRDDCLAFKRFGLPARPAPPRLGLGRCCALARLRGVALG